MTAILAAAGRGRRFGAASNKVFAPLAGRTVLEWSARALLSSGVVERIVVAAAADDVERVQQLLAGTPGIDSICIGGEERADTIRLALAHLPAETRWVAVHDGARPLVSPALVRALVAAARADGAAVPAIAVSDTLKRSELGRTTVETASRAGLFAVQTPQVFDRGLLERAYAAPGPVGTDDASYVERLGHPVTLVPGERRNIKITVRDDLEIAEGWMRGELRTGFGYDVHRLTPARDLVLGGVPLTHPEGLGLEGHSDADVLLHAICDALLGAAALGDIGTHFPNTDPAFSGISSLELLQRVRGALSQAGWFTQNVDAMLIAEQPRIRPHVEAMRAAIADALGIDAGRISVKATTNERLGFEGREEGMAAHAVATICSVQPDPTLPSHEG